MKRVFISSTCNNLSDIREIIERKLMENGIESSLSERPEFDNDPRCHPHDACLLEINKCDAFIAIIGNEYGKEYMGKIRMERADKLYKKFDVYPSISWMEMDYAIEYQKPIFIIMQDEIYTDMKFYKTNGSLKELNLNNVKDKRIFNFIHYFNNKEQTRWIKFYHSLTDLDKIIQVISERVINEQYDKDKIKNSLDDIMPEFQYRSRKKVALLNLHSNWDNYSDKLWVIKSYLFERGYEAEVIDVDIEKDIEKDIESVFPQFSVIMININAYSLIKACKIFSYAKDYSNVITIATGSFVEKNYAYLKNKFFNIIDVVIPYNNIKAIYHYIVPYLNFKGNAIDQEDKKNLNKYHWKVQNNL